MSVGSGRGGDHQQPATAKLPAELGGEPIGDPGATQLVEQGQTAQADGDAHEKLQDGFEHARPLHWSQNKGLIPAAPLPGKGGGRHAGSLSGVPMAPDDPLPPLSLAELETLLAALDPRLDGFGEGESCLDDALAYLARLGVPQSEQGETPALIRWLEGWRVAGGDRRTLRLMVATLLAQRSQTG